MYYGVQFLKVSTVSFMILSLKSYTVLPLVYLNDKKLHTSKETKAKDKIHILVLKLN